MEAPHFQRFIMMSARLVGLAEIYVSSMLHLVAARHHIGNRGIATAMARKIDPISSLGARSRKMEPILVQRR
ncbi:unnamed protein product [Acidocella sp. C78]|nr:unnamed protein product [Acidocella sp. C78]